MPKCFVRNKLIIPFLLLFPVTASAQSQTAPGKTDTAYINKLNAESFDLLKTNPDSERLLAQEAIRLSDSSHYLMGMGDGFIRLGILEKDLGNYEQAIAYYKQSLGYRLIIGDRDLVARVYNNIGTVFTKQSR